VALKETGSGTWQDALNAMGSSRAARMSSSRYNVNADQLLRIQRGKRQRLVAVVVVIQDCE
jgi:hypothetical protein